MPTDARGTEGVPFPNHHMFGVNTQWAAMLPSDTAPALRLAVAEGDQGTEAWLAGKRRTTGNYSAATAQPAFDLRLNGVSGTPLQIVVVVENARAGHPFPVGAPDLTEAWLFAEVVDPDGVVYASGELDEVGKLPASAHRFGATLLDANSAPLAHHDIFGIAAIGERRLLVPGEPREETFFLPADVAVRYPLDVHAELRYRRARRSFVDDTFGPTAPSFPVTRLASASCHVERPGAGCT
ncbi:MAG: hypothetical protein HY270_15370 [Deltaproteobacteria bacterium]|nr:hypothetical protein [Deltaproteobacteria bacterium]